MVKEKKDKHFVKKPYYKGGPDAMKAFINQNLNYPKKALKEGVQGTVVLRITIDYKGRVVDTRIISGVGSGCDEEAQRVAKLLQFEVEKTRGVKVTFHKKLHIHFRRNSMERQSSTVQYSVTPSEQSPSDEASKTGQKGTGSYNYSIKIPSRDSK